MAAKAIAGLLPDEAKVSGSIRFAGRELLTMDDRQLSEIRGRKIGFVFQDPARSLNPLGRVARPLSEAIRLHTGLKKAAVADKVIQLLRQVQLPDPSTLVRRYPHQ